jgi:endo-1,4-beta-xylanase
MKEQHKKKKGFLVNFVKRLNVCGIFSILIFSIFPCKVLPVPLADGDRRFLGNIILTSESPPSNFANFWNQVTCENQGKWGNVESTRDQMNWKGIDSAYNYAKRKGFSFKHHCFFWDLQKPGWIGGLSAAEQKSEAEEWIQAYADRYPDTKYIDVVNEPRDHTPAFSAALGGKGSTGWDWIVWAFETSRKYCPKALLLINEHNVEANMTNALAYREIISILNEKNLVDGVGIQCHTADIQRNGASLDTIRKCIDTIASLGVPLYPSELDLEGDDQKQLDDYKRIFPYLWEHPGTKGITLWGYQGAIWNTEAVLIKNGVERPALKWMRAYVDSLKKSKPTGSAIGSPGTKETIVIENTVSGGLHIRLASMRAFSLRILDPLGREVFLRTHSFYFSGKQYVPVPQSPLPKGLYLLTVTTARSTMTTWRVLGF